MRFWILVGGGALVLAAAIWPFGKKADEPASTPVAVHVPPAPPTPAKPEPPKVIEVLDLSRAYEPAREPEPITPATYFELPPEPERIDVMPREVRVSWGADGCSDHWPLDLGTALWQSLVERESRAIDPLSVMPREVPDDPYRGLLDEVRRASKSPVWAPEDPAQAAWDIDEPSWPPQTLPARFVPVLHGSLSFFFENKRTADQLIAVRSCVRIDSWFDIFRRVSLEDYVTRVAVMPRILPARFVIEQPDGRLLHYLEAGMDGLVRVPHGHSPAADHLTHPIPRKAFTVPLIPVEYLTVAPRPHVVLHREEQERQTGVREDDFVGTVGP